MKHTNEELAVETTIPESGESVLKGVIQRLRAEREDYAQECFEGGQQAGNEWCMHAEYRDLRMYASGACCWIHEDLDWDDFKLPEDAIDALSEFFGFAPQGAEYADYARGWATAVHDFMAEVNQKLTDDEGPVANTQ